jgi:uncharacterized secreted protein with C-terminal beta-propeller domain
MKKLFAAIAVMAILFALVFTPKYIDPAEAATITENMYLHLGSPIALVGGKIVPLDSENPNLAPKLYKNRTLVPLRVISEHFGATVNYDAVKREATIVSGDNTAIFPVGKSYFLLNGKNIALDTETLLERGRTLVPLRAIAEQVLGYNVAYEDSLIFIYKDADITKEMAKETIKEVKSKIGLFTKVGSLAALKEYVKSTNRYYAYDDVATPDIAPEAAEESKETANAALPVTADHDAGGYGSDYSETNTQVEGVDEGDIIKTDGKNIYIASYNEIRISAADSGKLTALACINLSDNYNIREMYIDTNRIIAVGNYYEYPENNGIMPREDIYYYGRDYTFTKIFDTTNITNIREIRSFEIEGYLNSSRKQDGILYLVTQYYSYYYDNNDPRPLIREDGKNASPLPIEDIMIIPSCPDAQFLSVSAIDIIHPEKNAVTETITGGGYTTYMSNNNLYICLYDYSWDSADINIARFGINGTKIGYSGSGTVKGYIHNQFALDEHEGFLRVATSTWDNGNNLFILNNNMDVCGSIEGFARDETIYSVRFIGKHGYIVTFRQIDPLFVLDLADPYNPQITGQLKVPGFSNYLHPVGENIILGIGYEVFDVFRKDSAGNDVVIGQQTGGIKLSLFDISNKGMPREISTLLLGDNGYSEALYNHKAIMFHMADGFLAFEGTLYSNMSDKDHFNGALLVSFKNNVLRERGRIDYKDPYNSKDYYNDAFYINGRLIYIGNVLYYAQSGYLRSFDINSLSPIDDLKL